MTPKWLVLTLVGLLLTLPALAGRRHVPDGTPYPLMEAHRVDIDGAVYLARVGVGWESVVIDKRVGGKTVWQTEIEPWSWTSFYDGPDGYGGPYRNYRTPFFGRSDFVHSADGPIQRSGQLVRIAERPVWLSWSKKQVRLHDMNPATGAVTESDLMRCARPPIAASSPRGRLAVLCPKGRGTITVLDHRGDAVWTRKLDVRGAWGTADEGLRSATVWVQDDASVQLIDKRGRFVQLTADSTVSARLRKRQERSAPAHLRKERDGSFTLVVQERQRPHATVAVYRLTDSRAALVRRVEVTPRRMNRARGAPGAPDRRIRSTRSFLVEGAVGQDDDSITLVFQPRPMGEGLSVFTAEVPLDGGEVRWVRHGRTFRFGLTLNPITYALSLPAAIHVREDGTLVWLEADVDGLRDGTYRVRAREQPSPGAPATTRQVHTPMKYKGPKARGFAPSLSYYANGVWWVFIGDSKHADVSGRWVRWPAR